MACAGWQAITTLPATMDQTLILSKLGNDPCPKGDLFRTAFVILLTNIGRYAMGYPGVMAVGQSLHAKLIMVCQDRCMKIRQGSCR
jgi:hypothetical protein